MVAMAKVRVVVEEHYKDGGSEGSCGRRIVG
jgi:hypothetical protein